MAAPLAEDDVKEDRIVAAPIVVESIVDACDLRITGKEFLELLGPITEPIQMKGRYRRCEQHKFDDL